MLSAKQKTQMEPYQILFPIGIAHAVIGSAAWILFSFGLVNYPGQLHAHHMFVGFLLSFGMGFMLTAIPRFTGTDSCSRTELSIAVALALISLLISHAAVGLGILLFISVFFARRLAKKKFSPPPHFLFLPIGLGLGISGTLLSTLVQFGRIDPLNSTTGRLLLFYGTMLSFLLGIGAKLISALLGWTSPPTHKMQQINSIRRSEVDLQKWVEPSSQAVLFISGFGLEIMSYPGPGRSLRALCATWIAVKNWHLYQLPKAPGKLPIWIWISAWMLILGLWIHALFLSLSVHAAHLIFIGGFGLMTLLVASRVTLAHGGHSLELETKSRIFAVVSLLMFLAAITRFSSPWTSSYIRHLAYAALMWIGAIGVWAVFFFPKIFFHAKINNG